MMGGLSRSTLIRGGLTLAGSLVLGMVVWIAGPLLEVLESRPLESVLSRLLLIALITLLLFLPIFLDLVKRKKASRALLNGLSRDVDRSSIENQKIADTFEQAMQTLTAGSAKKGAEVVYELPWYVFIGAPGSGKTSALISSGLKFTTSSSSAVKGIGGTRHCDWWFSDQAILIDTAGRFSTQDSDQTVDTAGWKTFLELLKTNRPTQPINGVLLTVSVEELFQEVSRRQALAEKLRARIQEVSKILQITPPIYLLVTKMDLLAGFNESFETFSSEQRQQGWGFTFEVNSETLAENRLEMKEVFSNEFDALIKRLQNQLAGRMEVETDLSKRHAIFGFPDQFSMIKESLAEMVDSIFISSKQNNVTGELRGIYLTSGTQQGTPFDRILGSLGRLAGRASNHVGVAKSYFIAGVLKDVVLKERHLVGFNPAVLRRRNFLLWGSVAVSALVCTVLLSLWFLSYQNNKIYVNEVNSRIPDVESILTQTNSQISGDVRSILPALNALVAVAIPSDFDAQSPGLTRTMGLSQVDFLQTGVSISYERALEQSLMPRVAKRIEERLRNVSAENLDLAYEALKHYLMLYSPEHFNADSLQAWIELDWDSQYQGALTVEQRTELSNHLSAMLKLGTPRPIIQIDDELVSKVRSMIASYPVEQRIFARLVKSSATGDRSVISVSTSAGPFAAQVLQRASGKPLSDGVSSLFTIDGYYNGFRKGIEQVALQLTREEPWVLANNNGSLKFDAQDLQLTDRVKSLYINEYIKVWEEILNDVRLIKPSNLDLAIQQARILSSDDSPLRLLLTVVNKQTRLAAGAPLLNKKVDAKLDKAKSDLAKLAAEANSQTASAAGSTLVEKRVDDHFQALHRLFEGQPPAGLLQMQATFNELFQHLAAVDAAKKSKGAPPSADALERIKLTASLLPGVVGSAVSTLTETGNAQSRVAERQSLSGDLQPITQFCSRAISGRYPFSSASKLDVLPEDFGQFFGQGGLMDEFFQRRLSQLVDTSRATWNFKPLPDGTRPSVGGGLISFQRASRIRDVFFRSGGRQPSFRMEIRLVESSDPNSTLVFDLDGVPLRFSSNSGTSQVIQWPPVKIASQLRVQVQPSGVPVLYEGPWSLFRMFDKASIVPGPSSDRFGFTISQDGKTFRFEGFSTTVFNPFRLREIQQFSCPTSL